MTETYVYDEETYPNIFTLAAQRVSDGARWLFEISDRRNDSAELLAWCIAIQNSGGRMVGFNNIGFDYPILHLFMQMGHAEAIDLFNKSDAIIRSGRDDFSHIVWEDQRFIPQIDLYKIHHFDNKAKSTSLKMLEFNMRSPNIEDLPYPPGTYLNHEQKDVLIAYNWNDVEETLRFLKHSEDAIRFREELSVKYNRNFLNHNDKKIGTDYFIMRLEEAGVRCHKDIQTNRDNIDLDKAIFPYIQFIHPEFQRIHQWFKNQIITETKGIFKDTKVTVNGFTFVFGLGGIHGSVEAQTILSDDEYVIRDADVEGYYPSVGIVNRIYPEHLGITFCDIATDIKNERKNYKKGTAENTTFKLANNGAFGDSNSPFSPLYDPLYTMTVTVNGQLLLCVLAEHLMQIPGLQMIQINTDGLTVRMPRSAIPMYDFICDWWQQFTCLKLEFTDYSRMFIRDVNSYIGEFTDGKLKRKGAYCHETPLDNPNTQEVLWHKNHSALVVPKAAEAALVHGQDIRDFIKNHDDLFDFMLRAKVPRGSKLMIEYPKDSICNRQLQNISRYYISVQGGSLIKVMPPTAKQITGAQFGIYHYHNTRGGDYFASTPTQKQHAVDKGYTFIGHSVPEPQDRRIGIEVGWLVTECNNIQHANVPINIEYYVQEAEKLVEPLR